jgi:hypothetical protein
MQTPNLDAHVESTQRIILAQALRQSCLVSVVMGRAGQGWELWVPPGGRLSLSGRS